MYRGKKERVQLSGRAVQTLVLAAICAGMLLTQGCGGGSSSVTQPAAQLQAINIKPTTSLLQLSSNRQLTATGVYDDGTQRDITGSVNWGVSVVPLPGSSTTPAASINVAPSGMITGMTLGSSVVSATLGPVVGLLQLTVNSDGYKSGTFAVLTAAANKTQVDAAYVPISKFVDAFGFHTVQVLDLDADAFSSTLPVQTALLASIEMPTGFVPNATAVDQNTQKVAVISYESPTVVVIDGSNNSSDPASNTVIGTFSAPVSGTVTFNGQSCMICALEVDPTTDQVILSTAQGYFSMDLTAGTFKALPANSTLFPAPSFTLDPVFVGPSGAQSPYLLSPTFGGSVASQLQTADLKTGAVASNTSLGLTSPGSAVIDLRANHGAVVDAGANAQALLDLTTPNNPVPTVVPGLGVCAAPSPQLFDMGVLGVGVGFDLSQIAPTFFLAQRSGGCVGFEVWPNSQSSATLDPSTIPYGFGPLPETPDGNAFVNGTDPAAIGTFTSVVDKKNYGVLINASQNWIAKVNFATVISVTGTFFGMTLPGGLEIPPEDLNAGIGGAAIVYLPTTGTVSLSALSLDFGTQTVGTTSVPNSITLTNTAATPLTISQIAVQGPNAGDFAQTNTCPTPVAAKGICTITLTFTPAALGARTATLSITDDGGNSPQTVALSGTGD
jgi:hypothetical protein